MTELSRCFGEILLITVASGFLLCLSPEGGAKKQIRFVISICLLAAIAVPLLSVVKSLPKTIDEAAASYTEVNVGAEEEKSNQVVTESAARIESALRDYLCAKFHAVSTDISVRLTLNHSDLSAVLIERIDITVPHGYDCENIKEEVNEMFLEQSIVEVSEHENIR